MVTTTVSTHQNTLSTFQTTFTWSLADPHLASARDLAVRDPDCRRPRLGPHSARPGPARPGPARPGALPGGPAARRPEPEPEPEPGRPGDQNFRIFRPCPEGLPDLGGGLAPKLRCKSGHDDAQRTQNAFFSLFRLQSTSRSHFLAPFWRRHFSRSKTLAAPARKLSVLASHPA